MEQTSSSASSSAAGAASSSSGAASSSSGAASSSSGAASSSSTAAAAAAAPSSSPSPSPPPSSPSSSSSSVSSSYSSGVDIHPNPKLQGRRSPKMQPSHRSAKSSSPPSQAAAAAAAAAYGNINPGPHSPAYSHLPSPKLAAADPASDPELPLPPPQTTHYWTSDSTRRVEYAAIDSETRGVKGWVRRHLCFGPRPLAFDDDSGSVRRYRLELEDDDDDDRDETSSCCATKKRRTNWAFWHLRKTRSM